MLADDGDEGRSMGGSSVGPGYFFGETLIAANETAWLQFRPVPSVGGVLNYWYGRKMPGEIDASGASPTR